MVYSPEFTARGLFFCAQKEVSTVRRFVPVDTIEAFIIHSLNKSKYKNWTRNSESDYFYTNIKLKNGYKVCLKYYVPYSYFSFQCSVPGVISGNNAIMPLQSDIPELFDKLNKIVNQYVPDIDVREFKINRLDTTVNYNFNTKRKLNSMIKTVGKSIIKYRRKQSFEKTGAKYYSKTQNIDDYIKGAEMKAHHHEDCEEFSNTYRVEFQNKSTFIKKHIGDIYVKDLSNGKLISDIFSTAIVRSGRDLTYATKKNYYSLIKNTLKNQKRKENYIGKRIEFCKHINSVGEEAAKKENEKLYYECRDLCNSCGIDLLHTFLGFDFNYLDIINDNLNNVLTKQEVKDIISSIKGAKQMNSPNSFAAVYDVITSVCQWSFNHPILYLRI